VREGLHKIVSADDTIVAISTPMGRSGVGVVRVSGSQARNIGHQFFKGSSPLSHRKAIVGRWETLAGESVDEVVGVLFNGPHSYTGEDVLEISAHGNPLILGRIVSMIISAGARPASPGEFTLRAVAHGKMDLIQAEAVRDFVEAQTDAQARIAFQQIEGAVSKQLAPIREKLVDMIAFLEAGIDFAEDDVEIPDSIRIADQLGELENDLGKLLETYSFGRRMVEGVRIVIVGRPNVGKSSLFNKLLSMERAIVTEIPGTTRDVLSEATEIDGLPVRLLDTAGVRETVDMVERIGVTRTLETLAEVDLALCVVDASSPLLEEDHKLRERIASLPHLMVANKADLVSSRDSEIEHLKPIWTSARTGEGLRTLREAIVAIFGTNRAEAFANAVLTTSRQYEAVRRAAASLRQGASALRTGTPHEMVLLDLYEGLSSLNELTGEITSDDILGRIFSTFCIGK